MQAQSQQSNYNRLRFKRKYSSILNIHNLVNKKQNQNRKLMFDYLYFLYIFGRVKLMRIQGTTFLWPPVTKLFQGNKTYPRKNQAHLCTFIFEFMLPVTSNTSPCASSSTDVIYT